MSFEKSVSANSMFRVSINVNWPSLSNVEGQELRTNKQVCFLLHQLWHNLVQICKKTSWLVDLALLKYVCYERQDKKSNPLTLAPKPWPHLVGHSQMIIFSRVKNGIFIKTTDPNWKKGNFSFFLLLLLSQSQTTPQPLIKKIPFFNVDELILRLLLRKKSSKSITNFYVRATNLLENSLIALIYSTGREDTVGWFDESQEKKRNF